MSEAELAKPSVSCCSTEIARSIMRKVDWRMSLIRMTVPLGARKIQ